MYRAVALLALGPGGPPEDEARCAELARSMQLEFEVVGDGQRVMLNGQDVTAAIRSAEVTRAVSAVADHPAVREELVRRQRELGIAGPSVAEGRDMGTVVFTDARWKFFLDADPAERAQRRRLQLEHEGHPMEREELIASIAERDRRDRERPVGALRIAEDAILVDTTSMSLERVVTILEQIVKGEMKGQA
jgi:cytidylate kinase